MSKITISINLCCYNGEKYLDETLQSIFKQTFKKWELVIINDGSTDSTEQIIKQYINQGWPIIYHYQNNEGLPSARNKAIELSKGEYLAFIDQDDLWLPEKLEKQVILFDDVNVGLVFSDTIFFNEDGIEKQLYKKKKPPTGLVFREILSEYFISLETVIIRKDALAKLDQYFNPFFQVIEEYDLFVRLAYHWKVAYVNEVLAKWRVHEASSTWKEGELFPKEQRIMLKQLDKVIPDFKKNYFNEIKMVKCTIALTEAIIKWKSGNRKSARNILWPYFNVSMKFRIIIFFTLFPYSLYKRLRRLITGFIEP